MEEIEGEGGRRSWTKWLLGSYGPIFLINPRFSSEPRLFLSEFFFSLSVSFIFPLKYMIGDYVNNLAKYMRLTKKMSIF